MRRALALAGDWIPAALAAVVVLAVAVDVAGRYLLRSPLRGAGEIAVLCLVWLVFLGAIGVSRRNEHIGIAFFVDRLPPAGRCVALALRDLAVAAIAAAAAWAALLQFQGGRFAFLPVTGLHRRWMMAAAIAGLAVVAALHLARALRPPGPR